MSTSYLSSCAYQVSQSGPMRFVVLFLIWDSHAGRRLQISRAKRPKKLSPTSRLFGNLP
jgi:hypothetical protein